MDPLPQWRDFCRISPRKSLVSHRKCRVQGLSALQPLTARGTPDRTLTTYRSELRVSSLGIYSAARRRTLSRVLSTSEYAVHGSWLVRCRRYLGGSEGSGFGGVPQTCRDFYDTGIRRSSRDYLCSRNPLGFVEDRGPELNHYSFMHGALICAPHSVLHMLPLVDKQQADQLRALIPAHGAEWTIELRLAFVSNKHLQRQ